MRKITLFLFVCQFICSWSLLAQTRPAGTWHFGLPGLNDLEQQNANPNASRLNAACPPNIDFESGDFSNWICYTGTSQPTQNTNNVVFTQGAPTASRHTIYSRAAYGTQVDVYGLFPLVAPNGSGYSVRLGNGSTSYQAERLSYTFTVPTGQTDFNVVYQYAVVLQDGGHSITQQPRFTVKALDVATGALISSCATFDYNATAPLGFSHSTRDYDVVYKPWTPVTINLSSYGGRTIKLEFTTYDCAQGGHFGYSYIDINSTCSNLISGAAFCAGASSVVLNGPPGFQTYTWYNQNLTQVIGTGASVTISPAPATNTIFAVDVQPFPGFGCRDTAYTAITVNPKPTAVLTVDTTRQCLGSNVFNFASTSSQTNGGTPMHQWAFGNGSTSPQVNTTYTYPAAGTYNVTLVVKDSGGNCTDTARTSILVDPNPVPTFNITGSIRQCVTGNQYTIQNTTPAGASVYTYNWNFGDGNTFTGATPPVHTYTNAGTYTITLVASGAGNCNGTVSKTITVDPPPTANFSIIGNGTNQCFKNNVFTFQNQSTSFTGDTLVYSWDFSDGSPLVTTLNAAHSFITAGTYNIKLTVTGLSGCSVIKTIPVTVHPEPVVDFAITTNARQCIQPNNLFNMTNNSTVATGTMNYQWSFGDNSAVVTTVNSSHNYAAYGNYNIKLLVTTNNGCTDTLVKPIVVDPLPVPSFTISPVRQCFGTNALFTFTNGTTIPQGTFTSAWSFGDGGNAATTDATHTYAAANTFTVKLVTTSTQGCTDSLVKTVNVDPQPIVNFKADTAQSVFCFRGNTIRFANQSVIANSTMSYQWNFGDNTAISTTQNPTHQFSTVDSFNVKLIVTSAQGCIDSITKKIYIRPNPAATAISLIANAYQQCSVGNAFQFQSTSSIQYGTYTSLWSFGDVTTSSALNPVKHYNSYGNFNIILVNTSNYGCTDTATTQVQVFNNPVADFTTATLQQCFNNNQYTYVNTSIGNNMSYQWDFGDAAGTSTAAGPTYQYPRPGSFNVKLVVKSVNVNGFACYDTAYQTIIVHPIPTGTILNLGSSDTLCEGITYLLRANGGATYKWYKNGAAVAGVTTDTFRIADGGTYTADIISAQGCIGRASNSIIIKLLGKPYADFAWTGFCVTKNVTFINRSRPGTANVFSTSWDFGDSTTSALLNPVHKYNNPRRYAVGLEMKSAFCPNQDTIAVKYVDVESNPIGVRYSPVNAVLNTPVAATARANGTNYLWLPNNDLNTQFSRNIIITPTSERTYTVRVQLPSGCETTDTLKVQIFDKSDIYVPKAFTPNQDGQNDKLFPILVGIKELRYFKVFNRWGNLVFSTNNTTDQWDGYYKNQLQQTDTYTWIAMGITEKGETIQRGGNVLLIR